MQGEANLGMENNNSQKQKVLNGEINISMVQMLQMGKLNKERQR